MSAGQGYFSTRRSGGKDIRITRISVRHVPLVSHTAHHMAGGKTCDSVETVLVGADPAGPEALMARLDRHLIGHRHAKSAIDIALWDLTGQAACLPLHALLGGRRAADMALYHSITCIAPDEMARIPAEAQATGIARFQVKPGADGDWQADVARLQLVREAVSDGPRVYGDWNCGATSQDATRIGRAVRDLDVMLDETAHDTAALLHLGAAPDRDALGDPDLVLE